MYVFQRPLSISGSRVVRKYPVLVFIHGESYEWNSGNPYDGRVLASNAELVVVTLNYRLGVLGKFLLKARRLDIGSAGNGPKKYVISLAGPAKPDARLDRIEWHVYSSWIVKNSFVSFFKHTRSITFLAFVIFSPPSI